MRYTLDWCLYDFPQDAGQTASNQCTSSCAEISNSLETNILQSNASTTYDYCQDPKFLSNVNDCASCYKIIPNQLYLSNFLNTLQYACKIQPPPALPFPIKSSDIFTYHPPSNYSDISASHTSSSHSLSHNARTAIAISVPVGVFLILSLLVVWLYVHKNTNSSSSRHSHRSEKYISKSAEGWSPPSTSPVKKGHSRIQSDNSRSVPYPAPLNPQRIPMPAPLRTRNSPIPFSKIYEEVAPPRHESELNNPLPLAPTKYSPPPERSTNPNPRPPASPEGLVSWERIAIQNAQMRATLGPSPSPVSPLTLVQDLPVAKSPGLKQDTPSRQGSPLRQGTPASLDAELERFRIRQGTPASIDAELERTKTRTPASFGEQLERTGSGSGGGFIRQGTPASLGAELEKARSGSSGGIMRSGSGSGSGVRRSESGRSDRARKEVRWSKDVDYE
ncbi:hypothetical protein MMC28_003785 [Mycoblastus sanguinarius]|nr:hypothetical protein [Mycoblastus sanguinarius]